MIERIEIMYFRSIYKVTIRDINELNVFTGKNDVGKSNVLKALNLFFNNFISEEGDYSFFENYNLKRLDEVRKDTIKGRQFIQISVTFGRGNSSVATLPKRFTITKRWLRDSVTPIVSDDVERQMKSEGKKYTDRSKSSVTRYMNSCKFIYVPAIKDEKLFAKMIAKLQESVFENKLSKDISLIESMNEVASHVSSATEALSEEFYLATSVKSSIETPTSVGELYRSLNILTKSGDNSVMLKNRGDGIQVRYLPSIINYLAINSYNRFIWGFEEPENSLEFNMARRMANDFYNSYRKNSQIFLTTHSPAFIDLGNMEYGSGYRCFLKDFCTTIYSFDKAKDEILLSEELGYAYILQEQYNEYNKMVKELETQKKKVSDLRSELSMIQQPVLLTEGKTDAMILNTAWAKIYNRPCPYKILSCSLTNEGKEKGGCGILANILKSVRHDDNKITIGLFDNDNEGVKAYSLDANYKLADSNSYKKHITGKGYAFLLPASTEELRTIAERQSLCIEFMFSHDDIIKEVDGKKLIINPPIAVTIIKGVEMSKTECSDAWYMGDIDKSTKMVFAEKIVPTLPKESFNNFIPIFNLIDSILTDANC